MIFVISDRYYVKKKWVIPLRFKIIFMRFNVYDYKEGKRDIKRRRRKTSANKHAKLIIRQKAHNFTAPTDAPRRR